MSRIRRKTRKSINLGKISLYGGRATADVIREADPAGRPVTHAKVATQTPLDTYLRRRRITPDEWQAGDRYRALCFVAALEPGMARMSWRLPVDRSREPALGISERQEAARRRLRAAERHLGPSLSAVLRHVILDRAAVGTWAQARGYREVSGMDFLREALDLLGRHWGMV